MAGKRKRSRAERVEGSNKRLMDGSKGANDQAVKHSLLSRYYCKVMTLREYLLSKLSPLSKVRRKKIVSVGRGQGSSENKNNVDECMLARYLDQTLIGTFDTSVSSKDERWRDWTYFSQQADKSTSMFEEDGGFCQSEVVDFAIWSLFKRSASSNSQIQHLLCQGFRKLISAHSVNSGINPISAIPGVVSVYPNHLVTIIKSPPWPQVLALLGKEGERLMIDLILDCGIFQSIESGRGNYFQLSGKPLGDLQVVNPIIPGKGSSGTAYTAVDRKISTACPPRTLGKIVFVRNRILYARAALNATGRVRFGLRHIHVFNRYPYKHARLNAEAPSSWESLAEIDDENKKRAIRVMMYMFPREFGLHNVFTSAVDPRETSQSLKDYTLREDEIRTKIDNSGPANVPKRLRGETIELVQQLQKAHSRCGYVELLKHYCPVLNPQFKLTQKNVAEPSFMNESTVFESQRARSIEQGTKSSLLGGSPAQIPVRKPCFMNYAIPTANVSAFCRAVMSTIIPDRFWGNMDDQTHNKKIFMKHLDRFIGLRRFESLSLHEVVQGIKLQQISWLAPYNSTNKKMSVSDRQKRLDLLGEFIYYLFDSILIPLIRTNFYVTESNIHRSRIFFFRQDVWRSLSEPALASLKLNMFEELHMDKAQVILNSRGFGFSHVRLLPKESGVRPIMNLKRRAVKNGFKSYLGPSINSVLGPVFNMLTLEKKMVPRRLGSAIFSVGDLYKKLRRFKMQLPKDKTLYFVKADVQAAFDTIPQAAVMKLMAGIPCESEYRISKHMEIKQSDKRYVMSKPIRKWTSLAAPSDDFETFDETLESALAVGKKNTVFVENIMNQFRGKDELLRLLTEHIQCNMVKIGKKYYRQKEGIPQGSVVSSLLCNYFYADLESQHFDFLNGESLLLRLIDDFLLITTNREHAKAFLQVMHNGVPEFGVTVNAEKTLTNFEVVINGRKLARLVGSTQFPYCGSLVDTKTLNITKDRERKKDISIADSLTVEFSRVPGTTFCHKILGTFKMQAHAMFLDTSFNSLATVLSNLFEGFTETAIKSWTYMKCLPFAKQPGAKLVIRTITSLVELADVLVRSKRRNNEGYKCAVSKIQIEWLVMTAFRDVLRRKQSRYGIVIVWLQKRLDLLKFRKECVVLRHLKQKSSRTI